MVAQAAVDAACQKLPAGFTSATPEKALGFGGQAPEAQVVLELRRDEEVTVPQWDYIPADFYYTISDNPGDGSGWPAFWRTLLSVTRPVTVSLLFQQTELHGEERNILGGIMTDLAELSADRTDYDIMYNPVHVPACMNAKKALEAWEKRIDQLYRPLLARLAVRADLATAAPIATALATAVGTMSGITGSHPMYYEPAREPIDVRQANFSFDWLEILPWGGHGIWSSSDAPLTLRRMPYLFGLNEAASLLVLPVPDGQGVAGIPRSRRAVARRAATPAGEPPRDGIRLGAALHHGTRAGEVVLPLNSLTRHTLIVGSSGAGKTTTVLSLLYQAWRDHQIPFLVIESVKTEYRSLLGLDGLEDLEVITLGREDLSPLRLNPLSPPPGTRCEVHLGALMAALKLALPLAPPLPQLLEEALDRTYRQAGWRDMTTIDDGLPSPTLRDLLHTFDAVFDEQGYTGEANNLGTALRVRLKSLLRGSRGRMFDTAAPVHFEELLRHPTIVEMNDLLDSADKAVVGAFLLDRIRAAARARGGTSGKLVHITVIEEAHRMLAKSDISSADSSSGDRLRADSVRAFCEAIAELRSSGEGFILSSQRPSELADGAVANTGIRVLHRLESAADRKLILDDLDAGAVEREVSARLRQGEALVRWPEVDEAEVIQVEPPSDIDSARQIPDIQVAAAMSDRRLRAHRALPFALCTTAICRQGCDSGLRNRGADIADRTRDTALRLNVDPAANPVKEVPRLLAHEAANDLQLAYCAAVHLSVERVAFPPGRTIKTQQGIAKSLHEVIDSA